MIALRQHCRNLGPIAGFAIWAAMPAAPAHATGTAAGIRIDNAASASFSEGATVRTVQSNTVSILVDELLDAAVASLDGVPVQAAGGSAVLAFSLTNPGNGPEAFLLHANPVVSGNDFDAAIALIAVDSNGNGTFDPGIDAQLAAPAQTAIIAPDASLAIFVQVTVPANAGDGQTSRVELTARALTGSGAPGTVLAGLGEGGGDAVIGTSGGTSTAQGSIISSRAAVTLNKSAVVADPFGGAAIVPGARVTYMIVTTVSGTGTVSDLVVSDPIPAGTRYQAASLKLDGQPLSDGADSDAGTAGPDGISVSLGTAAAGASHAITFNVLID